MKAWIPDALDRLGQAKSCGYRDDSPHAAEPAALAAMALASHGRGESAAPLMEWLAQRQGDDGSVGIDADNPQPGWPTSLAILAWCAADAHSPQPPRYAAQCDAAVAWLLSVAGEPVEKSPAIGHNAALIGWPWVLGTHSWIEPTAWAVLALKVRGQGQHDRTREAVWLLIDRLLPTGGCNYGNTTVLGQLLRPHLQPTGIAMLALAGESDRSGRVAASLAYLSRTLSAETPAASLAYGMLGLAAHRFPPADGAAWLAAAYERLNRRGADPLRLALLLLAAAGAEAPVIALRDHASTTR